MKKRLFSIFMCIFIIVSFSIAVSAENSNETKTSQDGFIEIRDRSGLEAISKNPGGSFRLMADIDMKDAEWTPISYSGIFDGNGHTIYNLKVNKIGAEHEITVDGNDKKYDTYFAGFFSTTKNATIKNLNLLNVNVSINTDKNCFASALTGYSENTQILNCSTSGRVFLETPSKMVGVSGIIGFGYGAVSNSQTDVTLVFVDNDLQVKCEQFMGGIISCGYGKIDNCSVKIAGFDSVQGYVHDGGIIGMYYLYTKDKSYKSNITNTKIEGKISFYENNTDRRAYCSAFIGELLGPNMSQSSNTDNSFKRDETFKYDKVLLPEKCENPQYSKTITQADCTHFGYTTYTCPVCGYTYTDDYIAPSHKAGEYKITREPSENQKGLKACYCTICGKELDEQEFSKLIINTVKISLGINESSSLSVTTLPKSEAQQEIVWTSSNEKVATVDDNGKVKATGLGKAVITCKSKDGATLNCDVSVEILWWQWLVLAGIFLTIVFFIFIILKRKNKKAL